MGTSLTGVKIKDSYDSLLKVTDNGPLDGSLQVITDGLGNNSALSLSTAGASVGGTLAVSGNAAFDTNTLFVDAASNQVGVGTTSLPAKLTIKDGNVYIDRDTTSGVYGYGFYRLGAERGRVGFDYSQSLLQLQADGSINFLTAGENQRMFISSSGDISFRDSSANEAFYWDASAASLGIGVVPNNPLHIKSSSAVLVNAECTGASSFIQLANSGGAAGVKSTSNDLILWTSTSGTERMRIDSSGNVTINSGTIKDSSGNSRVYWGTDSFISSPAGDIRFFAPTERMRITSAGDVLIGETSLNNQGSSFRVQANNLVQLNIGSSSTTVQNVAVFRNPNGAVGTISTNGSSTAYNTSSDYRLKEDWVAMEGALDRVDALKPINFAWKADGSRVDGFLAHELAEVVPEAVSGEKDATEIRSVKISDEVIDEEGNVITEAVYEEQEVPVYQGIDQSKVVPLLAAGLQEAHALIKELRAELNALKQA